MESYQADWNVTPPICRLCLHSDGFLLGIFNHLHGKEKNIYRKIIDCTALEISSGDGLPHTICHRCLFKLELCLDFRAQCFVSDSTLRQANRLAQAHRGATNGGDNGGDAHAGGMGGPPLNLADLVPPQPGDTGDVVVVVDPSAVDYDSDFDNKYGRSESNDHYEPTMPSDYGAGSGHHYPHHLLNTALGNHHANAEQNADQIPSDNELVDGTGEMYDFRNVFMCRYCDRAFTDKTQCTRHEAEDHDPSEPYSCKTCQLSFPDRLHYSAHLKSLHADDKPYDCPECEKMFARRSDLRKHTIVHTGIKPFTCPVCSKSFSRNTNLSKHMRIHAGHKPFVCPRCPKTFITKGDLQRHALIHSGRKPFPCRFCPLSFGRRDKMLRHEKRHFPQQQQLQQGGEGGGTGRKKGRGGGVVAKENGDWSENMIIDIDPFTHNTPPQQPHHHHHPPLDSATTSATQSAGDSSFTHHQRMDDDDDDDDAAADADDNRAVTGRRQGDGDFPPRVPDHIRAAAVAESSSMTYGRRSPRKEGAAKRKSRGGGGGGGGDGDEIGHVTGDRAEEEQEEEEEDGSPPAGGGVERELTPAEKAAKSKRYPCLQCHRRFSNMEGLKFHISQQHSNSTDRPFQCQTCSKGFIRKRELDRHMTTHTGYMFSGMKPFGCTSCDKRFGRKDKLVRHMRIHDGSNILACQFCPHTFTRKDSFWQHVRAHRREQMLQERRRSNSPPENQPDADLHEHENYSTEIEPLNMAKSPPTNYRAGDVAHVDSDIFDRSQRSTTPPIPPTFTPTSPNSFTSPSLTSGDLRNNSPPNNNRNDNNGATLEDPDPDPDFVEAKIESEPTSPLRTSSPTLSPKREERSSDLDEDEEDAEEEEEEDEYEDEDSKGEEVTEQTVVEIDDDIIDDKVMVRQEMDESNLENATGRNSGDPDYDDDLELDEDDEEDNDDNEDQRGEIIDCDAGTDSNREDGDEDGDDSIQSDVQVAPEAVIF